jgi:hypothetical protein
MGELKNIFGELEEMKRQRDEARADLEKASEEYKLLRDAARKLVDALNDCEVGSCDFYSCTKIATRFLGWEGDSECLCDEHAEEERNSPDNVAPLQDNELAIASPLSALRKLLEVAP